eukprot:gnl/TRDRNA2_/TRDRNA2_36421_c0_seq1.p1 gnl/TRDRNA2_/TRDRNA2_36421_c0~~gnl/TRDRNA2_/TRDRNA2_36421_c0_seq1.p1  ORF type:complete len:411 (+),score=77.35 gnl/TRDRNA2_/TRDRNA2_36421_c0_seq1:86-1318(+)
MASISLSLSESLVQEALYRRSCSSRKALVLHSFLASLGFAALLITASRVYGKDAKIPAAQEPAVALAPATWLANLGSRSQGLQSWTASLVRPPKHVSFSSELCPPRFVCMVFGGKGYGKGGGKIGGKGGGKGGGIRPFKQSFGGKGGGKGGGKFEDSTFTSADNRPGFRSPPRKKRGDRSPPVIMNFGIKAPELRVILQDGTALGIMETKDALERAQTDERDLVLISENANPPVAKIIDYSKFKYEKDKAMKENKKKQRENRVEMHELKMRVNIDQHDYDVKRRKAEAFLTKDGDKVKVLVQMRGREVFGTHGKELLQKFVADVGELAKVEVSPRMMGRDYFTVLSPSEDAKKGQAKAKTPEAKKKSRRNRVSEEAEDESADDEEATADAAQPEAAQPEAAEGEKVPVGL